ncbi:MAG: hypothetical protein ACRDIC_22185 [bacterium]
MSTTTKLRSPQICNALALVFDRVAKDLKGQRYCFVGTAAAVALGVPLRAGDVDILVPKRESVDLFARALSEFPCVRPPTWLPEARQYYTAFNIHGVQVEASTVERKTDSHYRETLGDGPYKHCRRVKFGRHAVPTIKLELRLATELARRRWGRYLPLIRWMQTHSCDTKLLRHAMQAVGVPERTQTRVLERIEEK